MRRNAPGCRCDDGEEEGSHALSTCSRREVQAVHQFSLIRCRPNGGYQPTAWLALRSPAIGGVHVCSPPAIQARMDEIALFGRVGSAAGATFGRSSTPRTVGWLGASFDLAPGSDPFEPFLPPIKTGRRMPPGTRNL